MNLEVKRLRKKYPNKIPTIVDNLNYGSRLPKLKKNKFLIQRELTVGQLSHVIRTNLTLDPSVAIYMVINNKIHPSSKIIGNIYNDQNNEGFLYIYYVGENTFG